MCRAELRLKRWLCDGRRAVVVETGREQGRGSRQEKTRSEATTRRLANLRPAARPRPASAPLPRSIADSPHTTRTVWLLLPGTTRFLGTAMHRDRPPPACRRIRGPRGLGAVVSVRGSEPCAALSALRSAGRVDPGPHSETTEARVGASRPAARNLTQRMCRIQACTPAHSAPAASGL